MSFFREGASAEKGRSYLASLFLIGIRRRGFFGGKKGAGRVNFKTSLEKVCVSRITLNLNRSVRFFILRKLRRAFIPYYSTTYNAAASIKRKKE